MKILKIIPGTSVDGPGLRTAIYFSGCNHRCDGCHNPQSWDFDTGKEMSEQEIIDAIIENDFDVTFTGGDPLYHASTLISLAQKIKSLGKTLWVYTGFLFEEIVADKSIKELLPFTDVVVDGPFIKEFKDNSLIFRGSKNQRIIDVKESLEKGSVVLLNL